MIKRLRTKLKFDNKPIKVARKFFKQLHKKLTKELRPNFENESELALFESKVQGLIEELIYAVYEPRRYQRTYNLLRSFRVTGTGDGTKGEISVWSDPRIATAKGDPDWSYAAFFERPSEYNTFLPPRGQATFPFNKRPFMNALFALTREFTERRAGEAVYEAITKLLPPELRS